MPELPDIELYVGALAERVVGRRVKRVRVVSPFVLRTVEPGVEEVEGKVVVGVERVGKRVVLALEGDLFFAVHLMIAGRFRWVEAGTAVGKGARGGSGGVVVPKKMGLLGVEFESGESLVLVEASPKKRAGVWVVRGREALGAGGVDVRGITGEEFYRRLTSGNHTVKRVLTDPKVFDGIGNAYSDEILHAAKVSPIKLTGRMEREESDRIWAAAGEVLTGWAAKLKAEFAGRFPGAGDVTAFRPDFAVHGKFGAACPVCGTKVQRIRYAENETNYCPRCQTGGKVLADRSMSRLLKGDWPGRVEDWE